MDSIFSWTGAAALSTIAATTSYLALRSRRLQDPSLAPTPLDLTALAQGSMKGKVALVTGGTSGVGFHTAASLASQGCTVFITSRSLTRAQAAARKVALAATQSRPGLPVATEVGEVHGIELDVMSFASVRACATSVLAQCQQLDALVLNAGDASSGNPAVGPDGLEWAYTQRVASAHLLTSLLWELMVRSGTSASPSRVVSTSGFAVTWLKHSAAEVASWLEGEADGQIEGKTVGKPAPHKVDQMAPMVGSAGWVRALGQRCDVSGTPVRCVCSHPGIATGTGLIPWWLGAALKLFLGGHEAALASLGNVAAVMCPAEDIVQGCMVGPMGMTQGLPGVTDLGKAEGPSSVWKVMSGPSGLRYGEMVLVEVMAKTGAKIEFKDSIAKSA